MWWYWPMTVVLCLTSGVGTTLSDDSEDNFSLSSSYSRACDRDGRPGECAHYSLCDDNYTLILPSTSDFEGDYFRNRTCQGHYDWCCFKHKENHLADRIEWTSGKDVCLLVKELDDCPWCVALYHRIEPNSRQRPRFQSKNGLYCAGALVGTRAVLTAAHCVHGNKDNMVVHVNGQRMAPREVYQHDKYKIGMPLYNVALLLLADDIVNSTGGACLSDGSLPPSLSECSAYGYGPDVFGNYFEDLPLKTKLSSVTEGMCSAQPGSLTKVTSVICAHIDNTDCSFSFGSPIVCGGKVVGVMSGTYSKTAPSASATSLWDPAVRTWLTATLTAQGVKKKDYHTFH